MGRCRVLPQTCTALKAAWSPLQKLVERTGMNGGTMPALPSPEVALQLRPDVACPQQGPVVDHVLLAPLARPASIFPRPPDVEKGDQVALCHGKPVHQAGAVSAAAPAYPFCLGNPNSGNELQAVSLSAKCSVYSTTLAQIKLVQRAALTQECCREASRARPAGVQHCTSHSDF